MNDVSMPWRSVSQLSEQIHAGVLSPVELMEHLLARVDSLNGKLNAFRPLDPARSLAAARAAEAAAGHDSQAPTAGNGGRRRGSLPG